MQASHRFYSIFLLIHFLFVSFSFFLSVVEFSRRFNYYCRTATLRKMFRYSTRWISNMVNIVAIFHIIRTILCGRELHRAIIGATQKNYIWTIRNERTVFPQTKAKIKAPWTQTYGNWPWPRPFPWQFKWYCCCGGKATLSFSNSYTFFIRTEAHEVCQLFRK